MEKMVYSYSAIAECNEVVSKIGTTVPRKNMHFAKAIEIKKAADKCNELTQCLMFDSDWNPYISDYFKHAHEHNRHTKKELDRECKRALRDIKRNIAEIECYMRNGEVDTRP